MAKIPRFYLKQGSSTPTDLMGRVMTIWEPHVCSKEDPLTHFKRLQLGIFGFLKKETGVKSVGVIHSRCNSVSFVVYIAGAKFEEHCLNIPRDIFN